MALPLTVLLALLLPSLSEAVIYANEGLNVMLTGGFNGVAASVHLPHTTQNGWICVSPFHHLCCDPHAFIFSNDVPRDSIAG